VGAVPVAAQLLVAPVLLLLNPWLPTWGVVANIVAAPAVAPASLLGLAAAGTAPWWPGGGRALATGAGLFTGWIAGVGRMVSGWPLARLPWPDGVGGAAALAALGMLAVAGGRWAKWRRDTRGLRRSGGSGARGG
jgi:competence protein ComEC